MTTESVISKDMTCVVCISVYIYVFEKPGVCFVKSVADCQLLSSQKFPVAGAFSKPVG